MRFPRAPRLLALSLLAFGLAAAVQPAAASHQEAVLGSKGELYTVRTGAYGDLFPAGRETDKANPVLAIDIIRPGTAAERHLVAGTADKDVESTPALVFEDDSDTVFIVWESRINSIHSIFRLASYDGAHWSDPIEITGNPFSLKTPPQLAITRDTHRETDSDGNPVVRHRSVLHIGWSEENSLGLYDAYYTPIILEEGAYLGWNPVYRLDGFDGTTVAATAPASAADPNLVRAPTLQPGRDGQTVVAAFASSVTGRIATAEIDVLPTQLQRLADKARAYIIDLGVRRKMSDLQAISAKAKTFLIDNGGDYQPEVAHSISDLVGAYIVSTGHPPTGPGGIQSLAAGARAYIIDLGAKLSGRGLKDTALAATASGVEPQTLEISSAPVGQGDNSTAAHIFQVRPSSSLAAPQLGDGAVRVFTSDTGDELLVSWASGAKVTYRLSQASGWSDPREIVLSDTLDLDAVYDILAQRVRRH
jgi:hypothetical protein